MFILDSKRSRNLYFFSLFVLQGLVPGFSLTALFNSLAAAGASTATLSFYFAVIGAPWCLQVFAAPFVDRFDTFAMGRRRSWILFAAAGANLALLPLLTIQNPAVQVSMLAWTFFVHSCFSAVLNIACDALIVDRTPLEESSATGAFARSGLAVASAVSGVVFAFCLPRIGFINSSALLILIQAAVTASIVFTREDGNDRLLSFRRLKRESMHRSRTNVFKQVFAVKNRKWFALTFCSSALFSILKITLTTDLLHRHVFTDAELSSFQALMSLAIGTAGAYLATRLVRRLRVRKSASTSLAAAALIVAGLSLFNLSSANFAYGVLTLLPFAPTVLFIAILPTLMSLSKGNQAATQFAAFMAFMNAGETSGAAVVGLASAQTVFIYAGVATGFALLAFAHAVALRGERPNELISGPTTGASAATEPTKKSRLSSESTVA